MSRLRFSTSWGRRLVVHGAIMLLWTGCLLWVGACNAPQTPESEAAPETPEKSSPETPGTLQVSEATVQIFPGGHGAVYLRVTAPTEEGEPTERLLSIETSLASRVELHETVEEEGVMRMRPHPDGFEIPSTGTLTLQPGGKHGMLMDAGSPEGDTVPLTLHFQRAGSIAATARVLGIAGAGGDSDAPQNTHHHDGHHDGMAEGPSSQEAGH